MSNQISSGSWNLSTTSGYVIDTAAGDRPATPKQMLATRAIQVKGGWLGQIIMRGEVVFETKALEDSGAALEDVNTRIHEAFRRLIVGA